MSGEAEMNNARKKSAAARRSPDGALRAASNRLALLGDTLLSVQGRLDVARHQTFMIGTPNIVRAIDELSVMSENLGGIYEKITAARNAMKKPRTARRRRPKGDRKN